MTERNPRVTYWFGTWNIPEDLDWKQTLQFGNAIDNNGNLQFSKGFLEIVAMAAAEERGESGNRHIHIVVKFSKKVYRTQIVRYWLTGPDWEPMKGTLKQALDYINKTKPDKDHFMMQGQIPNDFQKKFDKEKELKDALKDLMSMSWLQFSEKWTQMAFQFPGLCMKWKMDHADRLPQWEGSLKVKNFWITGPPGCGKSYWARKQVPQDLICFKQQNKWWDNYDDKRTKVVLIEDAGVNSLRSFPEKVKVWADAYWFQAEVKNGQIIVNPQKWFFIVTSNYTITEIWPEPDDHDPIKRRFTEVSVSARSDLFFSTQLDVSILK